MNKISKLLILHSLLFAAGLALLSAQPLKANAATCASQATRQCISNISYWYNSCGILESIAQNCNATNQICQNGQCINKAPSDIKHNEKRCYNNNLYWYSSQGIIEDIYQNCSDDNQCTVDTCTENKCKNELKCDGSTCATGSQDYLRYCGNIQNPGQQQSGNLIISLFGKKESETLQWEKNINGANDEKINFLLIVKNTSNSPMNNVLVKTDTTNSIVYVGDLKIDNLSTAGNIVSGIDLGTMTPKTSKSISFTGAIQPTNQGTVQINASVNSGAIMHDSDYVILNVQSSESNTRGNNTVNPILNNFSKKWYIWIIIVIILIVVFIIIFRRISSNV